MNKFNPILRSLDFSKKLRKRQQAKGNRDNLNDFFRTKDFKFAGYLLKKNSSKIFSHLLLSAIVTTCCSCFPNNKAIAELLRGKLIAQENSESKIQKSDKKEKSESTSVSRDRGRISILEAIWKLLRAKREQEPALSSRSNICEITPGLLGTVNVIYSDRPLFLWEGTVSSLEIYLYTPFSLWYSIIEN